MVRRVGRALRRRYARHRHHRAEYQDGRRSLPHATHRQAARGRALDHDRGRQGAGSDLHGRRSRRLQSALVGQATIPTGAGGIDRRRLCREQPAFCSTIISPLPTSRISERGLSRRTRRGGRSPLRAGVVFGRFPRAIRRLARRLVGRRATACGSAPTSSPDRDRPRGRRHK